MELKNETSLEFESIESECWREYTFPHSEKVRIVSPLWLNVSKSGGHRILDDNGISHYIPSGWVHLKWEVKDGAPNFVK